MEHHQDLEHLLMEEKVHRVMMEEQVAQEAEVLGIL